uniref:Putative ovule protein n=1 Tax=Solanum chacoense TaxID=4108 RepID=A0A0V0GZL4_SOLCH
MLFMMCALYCNVFYLLLVCWCLFPIFNIILLPYQKDVFSEDCIIISLVLSLVLLTSLWNYLKQVLPSRQVILYGFNVCFCR